MSDSKKILRDLQTVQSDMKRVERRITTTRFAAVRSSVVPTPTPTPTTAGEPEKPAATPVPPAGEEREEPRAKKL